MAAPVLQFKRGAFANLPGLRAGEPALTTDTFDLYVGIDSSTGNNKFFGSHRYWTKETATTGSGVRFVERTDGGSNYIQIKAPDTALAGDITYTLPGVQGTTNSVLTNDGSGNLTWSSGSDSPVFTGIATFTDTTNNVLGDENTGSVQLDGGMGIAKNLTVKENLYVGGYSEFVGVVTFKGGTITLGDEDTDDIVVAGEFKSSLHPTDDASYDIGNGEASKRWRNASFSGIGTFATGAVVDGIQIGITGATEIDTSAGPLTLDSFSGQTIVDDNLSVTGISTVTGAFFANGNVTLGDAAGDTITVNGTTTFTQSITGTISTATRATTVDTVQTNTNATHYLTFVTDDNVSATAEAVYTDAGITYNPSTDNLTLTGDLAVNGGDVTTSAATFNLVNATATTVNFAGAATAIGIGAATGTATVNNATVTLANATTLNVNGANPTIAGSSTGTLTLFNTNLTKVNAFQAATDVVLSATTGITTIRNNLTVGGDIRVNGNDIQASDGNTNITLASNTLTTFAGDIRVNGNDIQASDGNVNITMTSNTLTEVKGDLKVTGNDIQSSTGTVAITLADNDVTIADDLTVQGNLYVNGSTTQVNTAALTVEDRTIDLGIVNGTAPSSDTTWDLGVLFNYYTSGAAKKSAVVWEHEDSRFKFASVLGADTNGTDANTPQLTVTTFAPIEIGALWVNDCAGQSQVISCTSGVRNLENITIDAGTW